MNDTKKPWESKTMWAGVIALLALNAKSFGLVDISAADQAALPDIIVQIIQNGAVLVAMWSRYAAKKEITV